MGEIQLINRKIEKYLWEIQENDNKKYNFVFSRNPNAKPVICNTSDIKVTWTIPWNGAATMAYATQATVSSMECEVTIPLNSWIGSLYFYPLSYSVFLFVCFWLHHTACRILYPQPEMELRSPEVEAWSPNYWTTKEFSYFLTFLFQIYNWLSKILWTFFTI